MCEIFGKTRSAAAPKIAAGNNFEANQQADIEARMRKRRAGAAANVLTSPLGIPAAAKMGTTS